MAVIRADFNRDQAIDVGAIKRGMMGQIKPGLIGAAEEVVVEEVAADHTSEPLKDLRDIEAISNYFKGAGRYRDNMMFIVGINFGLRVSDLIQLRFCNLINDDLSFKDTFAVFERKTRNTRKHKKNRYITINTAVMEAVVLYLENTPGVKLSDFMFRNEASNASGENVPIHRCTVDRVIKGAVKALNINIKASTHTLRKTWAYHQMVMSNNDNRKLLLLSKMMGHSSPAITLEYIGITGEEISEAYRNLNLGSSEYNYSCINSMAEERTLVG